MPKRGSSKFAKLRANSFRPKAKMPKTSSRSLTRLAGPVAPRLGSSLGSSGSMPMAGSPQPDGLLSLNDPVLVRLVGEAWLSGAILRCAQRPTSRPLSYPSQGHQECGGYLPCCSWCFAARAFLVPGHARERLVSLLAAGILRDQPTPSRSARQDRSFFGSGRRRRCRRALRLSHRIGVCPCPLMSRSVPLAVVRVNAYTKRRSRLESRFGRIKLCLWIKFCVGRIRLTGKKHSFARPQNYAQQSLGIPPAIWALVVLRVCSGFPSLWFGSTRKNRLSG